MGSNLEQLIGQLTSSGKMPPELLRQIEAAINDSGKLDEMHSALEALGADRVDSNSPFNIEDYYREGTKSYECRWPILTSLPMAFSQLDRKSQFFVLFQEWTRREMEGMMTMNEGRLEEAQETFHECLERARQMDVGELIARSYEDLGKVADRAGDRTVASEYSRKAAQARVA